MNDEKGWRKSDAILNLALGGGRTLSLNIIVSIEGGTFGEFGMSSNYVISTEIHLILQTILKYALLNKNIDGSA